MSTDAIEANDSALLEGPKATKAPEAPIIVQVSRDFGISPINQLKESLGLRFGPQRLRGSDYYTYRLFDPDMSKADKRAFVGVGGIKRLNAALTPPKLAPTRAFVGNKLLYTELLGKLGLATTETQALVSTFRHVGKLPVLRDAEGLIAFLREDARYPLFGKPHHGSQANGTVRIDRCSEGMLHLGNGATRRVEDFATDVFKAFSGGYLLQTALDPHPEMAAIAGPMMGCVRVVTANDGNGARPVYAVWKLPAPNAMSDNFWQKGSILGALDLETGGVTRAQLGSGVAAKTVETHPVSGAQLVGTMLPFWQETLGLAADAHNLFPEFGVCGFDVAVTGEGPRILECNDNPNHGLYQFATGRGAWNETLAATWTTVIARQEKQLARQKAALKAKGAKA